MTPDKVIDMLMQVPLAGVNIIVVVLFLQFLERNDDRQKSFISDQRKDNQQTIINLSSEIAKIDADVAGLKVITVEHHALMLAAITEMRQAILRRSKQKVME